MVDKKSVRRYLINLGVEQARWSDEGIIRSKGAEYVVESQSAELIKEESKTTLLFRPAEVPPWVAQVFCIFGFEPWCWVRKYKDPDIKFDIKAVKADNINVYLLSGRITGTIVTMFNNNSEEGETWLENVRTGEQKDRQKVEGSADLSGNFSESILIKKLNETLAQVKNAIDKTKPKVKVDINTNFEKKGYVDMIKNIFRILLEGKIYVDDDINVTVSWQWLSQTKSKSYKIHVTAYLPVGDVHWHLW